MKEEMHSSGKNWSSYTNTIPMKELSLSKQEALERQFKKTGISSFSSATPLIGLREPQATVVA